MIHCCIHLCFVLLCLHFVQTEQFESDTCATTSLRSATEPTVYTGLDHVVAYQHNLFSGGKPEGELGFNSLRELQVATVLCVDGLAPDVETARKFGIKSIHIPLKYNSPTRAQVLDLCTAYMMHTSQGNVYIHCHHGKHRSASAAALISIALELSTAAEMKEKMRISGTSLHYKGLWDAVDGQQGIDVTEIIKNKKVFPEAVKPSGITEQMIDIDEALDRLLLAKKTNWITPETHPDLAPTADAGVIAETFRSMLFDDDPQFSQEGYTDQTHTAFLEASRLEEILKTDSIDVELFNEHVLRVERTCVQCHERWRK